MKQLCAVVMLIWYICLNENYSLTRAETNLISFSLNEQGNVSLSCNTFSSIRIVDIYIDKESMPYSDTKCKLNAADIAYLQRTCNGRNECILGMEWSTLCIGEYGYYNVSYNCTETCNFEESQCEFVTASTSEHHWRRVKGSDIPSIIEDLTIPLPDHSLNTTDGHFMVITSEQEGALQTQTFYYQHIFCLSFWYFSLGFKNDYEIDVELYVLLKETLIRVLHFKADKIWYFFQAEIYIGKGEYIRLLFSSKSSVLFGIDDVSLSVSNNCLEHGEDNAHIVTGRLSTGGTVTLAECPSFFLNNLNVNLMYEQTSPVCQDNNYITQIIEEYCATYYRWTLCTFNLKHITNDSRCLQPEKDLVIIYQCLAETSTIISTTFQNLAETSTVISRSIQNSASNPMYTIIIVSVLVIVLTSLGVIIAVVCYRRKNAKHAQPIGTRQEGTANDMTDSTDYTTINYNEMKDIDISKINENRKNKITTLCNLQGNKASADNEEDNCYKYESLATIRISREHIYESGCAHDNQYQSLTNQREFDEHSYESTEHALAQYQSLTNRDNHAYESTSLHTGVLQNKK